MMREFSFQGELSLVLFSFFLFLVFIIIRNVFSLPFMQSTLRQKQLSVLFLCTEIPNIKYINLLTGSQVGYSNVPHTVVI